MHATTMHDLILHHYPMSPFAEKARLMLGLKDLAWHSVHIPSVMPKPDVTALTGINLFNYVDRYVLSALNTRLELPPEEGGLGLTKGELGDLYSAFIVVYALTSPAFGLLGDRFRRTWIIAGAVALWSVATCSCGLMNTFLALLIARACTGIGLVVA